MLKQISLGVARRPLVRRLVVSTPGLRDVAWRFVAGEDLDAGIASLRDLAGLGIRGTLNHVGTHVHEAAEATAAADALIEAIHALAATNLGAALSVKLTQIGLDIDLELCRRELRRVLDAASAAGVFVRIDMEETPYAARTIGLFEEVRDDYGAANVGIVLQSYLRGGRPDLERLVAAASRIRLVKGGYWERPEVVYRTKAEVDAAFVCDMRLLLEQGIDPAIATHDPAMVDAAVRIAAELGIPQRAFEFQMLLGVARPLQVRLARQGYRVRCYVPYGGDWFLYFLGCLRRLPATSLRGARQRVRGARGGTV